MVAFLELLMKSFDRFFSKMLLTFSGFFHCLVFEAKVMFELARLHSPHIQKQKNKLCKKDTDKLIRNVSEGFRNWEKFTAGEFTREFPEGNRLGEIRWGGFTGWIFCTSSQSCSTKTFFSTFLESSRVLL